MSYTFAIGDIHGCLDKLVELVRKIEAARPGGKIVFLGDYVDRGPNSKGVIDFIMAGPTKPSWQWVALKGNHEDMMVDACSGGDRQYWIENGGKETEDSYAGNVLRPHIEWAAALPMIHSDAHRIYVHAGLDETKPIDQQNEHDLMWSRRAPEYSGVYWGKHLVHGHTPSTNNPRTIGNRTNVDSGAVFGGRLSCAVFHDDTAGEPIDFMQAN